MAKSEKAKDKKRRARRISASSSKLRKKNNSQKKPFSTLKKTKNHRVLVSPEQMLHNVIFDSEPKKDNANNECLTNQNKPEDDFCAEQKNANNSGKEIVDGISNKTDLSSIQTKTRLDNAKDNRDNKKKPETLCSKSNQSREAEIKINTHSEELQKRGLSFDFKSGPNSAELFDSINNFDSGGDLDHFAIENNLQKVCFVCFLGAPNTGKSTLLNKILGSKVSIVSHRSQTTQSNVRGILTTDQTQVIFTDTPGIMLRQKKSNIRLRDVALKGICSSDPRIPTIPCIFVQASIGMSPTFQSVANEVINAKMKFVLIISKIDLAKESQSLGLAQDLYDKYRENVIGIFFVSSTKDRGVQKLINYFIENSKKHPWIFTPNTKTDTDIKIFCAEITREKILKFIKQEIPYNVSVTTTQMAMHERGLNIAQTIACSSQSHKLILIGKRKDMLQKILATSQETMSQSVGLRVTLFLDIIVKK